MREVTVTVCLTGSGSYISIFIKEEVDILTLKNLFVDYKNRHSTTAIFTVPSKPSGG